MRPANPEDAARLYEDAKALRANKEYDFRLCAAYCMPRAYGQWLSVSHPVNGRVNDAAQRFVYDSTGVRSLPKYVSILQRLVTPDNNRWHSLRASDDSLMRVWRVRDFFDQLTAKLFRMRYQSKALFVQAQTESYAQLGVYGTAPKSIMWRRDGLGFAYKAWSLRDVFFLTDDEGNITHIFRRMFVNARQFKMKFGAENAPKNIAAELSKPRPDEMKLFEIVHIVHPREDYDPKTIGIRRMKYTGYYLSVEDKTYIGEEEGFVSKPYVTARTFTEPEDVYGYSPAMQALPALGGASQMKKTNLKAGHKAVDPPLLVNDDGVISGRVDIRPGAQIMGGVNRQGVALVKELATQGRFEVSSELLQDERGDIKDAFMVTLFEILADAPQMTATQVMERVAEKASLIAPTMGRLQCEDTGATIEREIELLAEKGELGEMPPELIEAKGDYEIEYTSPLAKSLRAEDVAGFMRTFEMAINAATATQDTSPLDHFDLDTALPEIASIQNVPTRWMADPAMIAKKRDGRAQQQQVQTAVDAAPALAGVASSLIKTGSKVA